MNLEEATKKVLNGEFKGRAIAVTFDDGYRDNFDLARDILKKNGVPATFFVPINPIDSGELYWWDYLHYIIQRYASYFMKWGQNLELPPSLGVLFQSELPPQNEIDPFCRNMMRCMNGLENMSRQAFLDNLMNEFGHPEGERLLMNWDEIRRLKADGFPIASHTVSHRSLVDLPIAEAQAEVSDSRVMLSKRLGCRIAGFSYPRGDWNDSLADIVEQAGYSYAVTTRFGSNKNPIDVYGLTRRNMSDYQGIRAWMPVMMCRLELTGVADKVFAARRRG